MADSSDTPPRPIYEVKTVELSILQSAPPTLCIAASGVARSGGWSAARLHPDAAQPHRDGIAEFWLEATPPPGDAMVTQALSPIVSDPFCWRGYPADLRAIRVRAETNVLERTLP